MARARPHLERPADRTAYDCVEGEHERCSGHHWALDADRKPIPAVDPISGKVIGCTCGCHTGGRPWPFEAEGYVPPERVW